MTDLAISIEVVPLAIGVGTLAVTAVTGALTYLNTRMNRMEATQRADVANLRQEMQIGRSEATVSTGKTWHALDEIKATLAASQLSASEHRVNLGSVMATKEDLHREIDKLAALIRPAVDRGSD